MSIKKTQKTILLILGAFFVMFTIIRCTKEGTNASKIARSLVEKPDSTVFSSFNDTFVVAKADTKADVNDVIRTTGVLSIIKSNCASSSCHGGAIAPKLTTYNEIKALVTPGSPEGSQLFDLITTSNVNRAMPPINYGVDLSVTEKTKIYNWIKNGAMETPGLVDFRPAAVSIITNGCASGNCHNAATVGGEWARKGWFTFTPADTVTFAYINPGTGTTTYYAQLKEPLLTKVWTAYKDSVKKFYADTLANASFRPFKTFGTPWTTASRRGPLNSYDDIIMDIMYPKGVRSNSSVVYTDPVTTFKYYVKGDYLNSTSSFITRIDSTMVLGNPRTAVFASHRVGSDGDMAFGDGGLSASEIAIIKAWYFADPNIPDVWKYGIATGTGIFKYWKTGNVITK
jgi:hypothetical protein